MWPKFRSVLKMMKTKSLILSLISTLSLTTTLTGCGGAGGMNLQVNQDFPIAEGSGILEDNSILNTTLGTPIAKDLSVVIINKQIATIVEEFGNKFIQLRSMGGTSSIGAFYGNGIGNKSLIGLGGDSFAGKLVSEFQSIKYKTRELATNPSGSYNIYLNMLVDLNCNNNDPDYVLVISDQSATTVGAKGNWYSYQINANDLAFKSVIAKGGLPSHTGSVYATLTTVSAAHPTACFLAADVFDHGMKREQKLAPFLLIHGDSAYNKASAAQVDDIALTVGTKTISFTF